MKLTVYSTSEFDFRGMRNADQGLVFEIEQSFSAEHGFNTYATNKEYDIVLQYKNAEELNTELNDELIYNGILGEYKR